VVHSKTYADETVTKFMKPFKAIAEKRETDFHRWLRKNHPKTSADLQASLTALSFVQKIDCSLPSEREWSAIFNGDKTANTNHQL
jgi:hypothetical protein